MVTFLKKDLTAKVELWYEIFIILNNICSLLLNSSRYLFLMLSGQKDSVHKMMKQLTDTELETNFLENRNLFFYTFNKQ